MKIRQVSTSSTSSGSLNVDDASAVDYIKLFTLLDKEQIEKIEAASAADPSARIVQRALAQEVTKIVHGEERLAQVEKRRDSCSLVVRHSLTSLTRSLVASERDSMVALGQRSLERSCCWR